MALKTLTMIASLLIFFTAFNPSITYGEANFDIQIVGNVTQSDNGETLRNASILVWGLRELGIPILESKACSDSNGFYNITITTSFPELLICVFYDDPDIDGIEGFPALVEISSSRVFHEVNFILERGSTVHLSGAMRLVDALSSITDFEVRVLDYDSNDTLTIGDTDYIFGSGPFSLNQLLELEDRTIPVPSNTAVKFELDISYIFDEFTSKKREQVLHHISQKIILDRPEGWSLAKGESAIIDVRRFTLERDFTVVDRLTGILDDQIADNDRAGFYTIAERRDLSRIIEMEGNARLTYSSGVFEEAYIDIRAAYLSIKDLYSRLLSQRSEASRSLQQLVILISLNGIILSYLIFEFRNKRIVSSLLFSATLSLFLYSIHPGKNFLSISRYVSISFLSISGTLAIIYLVPKLAGRFLEERYSFISSITSIISMGKRSLLRRKLRFVLTFGSIFILSLAFVAMTSASMNYGLIYNPQSWVSTDTRGLMIKENIYNPTIPQMKGRFYDITEDLIEWVGNKEGVISISEKVESFPSLEPYDYIEDQPIYAILGLDLETEPILPALEECIVSGSLTPDSKDGALISNYVFNEISASIGDSITVGDASLTIEGVFNKKIRHLKELNGDLLIPNKHEDIVNDPTAPMIVVEPCDYEYLIITNYEKALDIDDDVRISRLVLKLEDDVDPIILGKSLALERGIRVWSSTREGVFLSKVGETFKGKGTLIVVPYVIVVLNVLITMFQSFYERRREVNILSSVGLNPSHISGILVVESSVIAILAGGFGHLAGLSLYPVLSLLAFVPVVRQKISAFWSLGTLGIALAAATLGVVVSLKWSVNITPSLSRKWSITSRPRSYEEPWIVSIPAKIHEEQYKDFVSFLKKEFRLYEDPTSQPNIMSLRGDMGEKGVCSGELLFWYREGGRGLGGTSVRCVMKMIEDDQKNFYKVELRCFGTTGEIYKAGNFVRHVVMKWSIR